MTGDKAMTNWKELMIAKKWDPAETDGREGDALSGPRLRQSEVQLGHGVATIHAVAMVRGVAEHSAAALH
jgi:hypothetical protein